jgi:hypothetical protein
VPAGAFPVLAGIRSGEPEIVSVGEAGELLTASSQLEFFGISADAARILFTTTTGALLRDIRTDTTSPVSVLPDGRRAEEPVVVGMSADGARVAFAVEAGTEWELYLRDVVAGATVRLSADVPLGLDDPLPEARLALNHFFPGGWEYTFGWFGDTIEVLREALALPAGVPGTAHSYTGLGEVYRFDVNTGQRTLTAEYEWFYAPNAPPGLVIDQGTPYLGSRSPDGRWSVFFSTEPEDPPDPGAWDHPPRGDYFLHDFVTGTTRLISATTDARRTEWPGLLTMHGGEVFDQGPVVSADGSRVIIEGGSWVAGTGDFADYFEWVPGVPVLWDSGSTTRLTDLPPGARVTGADGVLGRLGVIIDGLPHLYEASSSNLVRLGASPAREVRVSADGSAALVVTTSPTGEVVDLLLVPIETLPFDDVSESVFADDIVWLSAAGITRGCTADGTRFCPDDPVTRGQMAAFLNRALGLPVPPEGDRFIDDGGIFETDIEALAAAGITRGCTADGTRFCPDDPVTRGQMAAFLNRALGLPVPPEGDRFIDDGGIFETDIEALAAAGITRGCTADGTRFCPDDPVTRGQMAAFLYRGLVDG